MPASVASSVSSIIKPTPAPKCGESCDCCGCDESCWKLSEFSLEGKVAVVTGASQGLGQQILAAFALSGTHGAIVDLKQEGVKSTRDKIVKTFGTVDILVTNAGISGGASAEDNPSKTSDAWLTSISLLPFSPRVRWVNGRLTARLTVVF
ncbi:gluconate 5-dehydrogenase [Stemphylium lycopersici]|nr:gluconate 5-dehydrogenase [Stemphylium lycopersici]